MSIHLEIEKFHLEQHLSTIAFKTFSGSFQNHCNDIWTYVSNVFFEKCCKTKISISKVFLPSLLKHSVDHFEDIRMIFGHAS